MNQEEKNKNFKNIYLLGFVSLLNDLSSEMIAPLLPIFISLVGGGGISIGLIGGLRESLSNFLKIASGYFSDKFKKRKPFIYLGYGISGFFKLLLGLSKTLRGILINSTLERIGKGLRTAPRDAIIAQSAPKATGKAFGLHRTFDTLGAILGTLVAILILEKYQHKPPLPLIKSIIILAALISLFSLMPLIFVKEIKENKKEENKSTKIRISFRNLEKEVKKYFLAVLAFSLANFSYMFFILKSQEAFSKKAFIIGPVMLYLLFNISYTLFSYPLGKAADKYGKKKIILLGYLLFLLTLLGFIIPTKNKLFLFVILFSIYGISNAATDANQRAYVGDISPSQFKGTYQGILQTIIGTASLVGNLIAGFLWNINKMFAFSYGIIFAFFAIIIMAQIQGKNKQPE